jgi:hypothetical protein
VPLHSFACPYSRLAKALDPSLHGLRDRDLACLSQSIVSHPQIEFLKATTVPAVIPRVCSPFPKSGPKNRPSASSKSMRDRRLSITGHETGDHGHAAQHILDGADVEAGEGTAQAAG